MKIETALQDYITLLEINKCSATTVKERKRCLNEFLNWLQAEHNVTETEQLQLAHLRNWLAHVQKAPNQRDVRFGKAPRQLKDSTIHTYSIIMLTFCHWLEHEGIIEKPITQRFKLPKVEEKFIPTYTPDDVQKLLDACQAGYTGRPELARAITARNRAIVSVFMDTGIRRSELVGLRLGDVDREMRLLIVHRKGNKWQQVPISRDGFKPLHEYLTKHRPYLASLAGRNKARKDDPVFLNEKGEQLTISDVSLLFYRLSKKTGIVDKKVSPHNCRRYMATTQISMGRSLFEVQRQMEHKSLDMTNRYASLSVEQLRRSHEEYLPLRAKHNAEHHGMGSGYWEE